MREWNLIKKEVLHKDYWNSVVKNTYLMSNGKINKDYVILDCRPVVTVCAITRNKKVVLIREYKQGIESFMMQLPAGYVDDNEDLEEAAKRELEEETGFTAEKFVKLGTLHSAAGKAKMINHGFLAVNAKKEKEQKLDENEHVEVMPIELSKALKMIEEGSLSASESVAFILMAANKLKREK